MDFLMHYQERAKTNKHCTFFDSLFAMAFFIIRDILILTARPIYSQLAAIAIVGQFCHIGALSKPKLSEIGPIKPPCLEAWLRRRLKYKSKGQVRPQSL
jgi:hypothetical protein